MSFQSLNQGSQNVANLGRASRLLGRGGRSGFPRGHATHVERLHLVYTAAAAFTQQPLLLGEPYHTANPNAAPGVRLQYEIYVFNIHTSANQATGNGVLIQGFDGDTTYTTAWQQFLSAGTYSFGFPEEAPLVIGENLVATMSIQSDADVNIEIHGAIVPTA